MRPRLRTMVAVVVGLALAGASLGAQPASAGITEVRSCDASTLNVDSFGQAWEVSAYGTSWIPQNTCPEGIVFDADSPTIWDHPEWVTWFNANTTSILRTAEFTYFGGDTSGAYRYTINACEDRWCDEIMELTPGADADSPSVAQVTLTSLQISSFAIQGRCVVEICPDPPPFVVKNFLLEYSDEVSPSLVNLNVTPSGATDPGSPVWLDGDELKLEFDAVDSGSGVALVVMGVDQPTTENLAGDKCGYGGRAAYCPAVAHISKTIDLSAVSSGEHLVRIVIYDAALSDPLVLDLPIRIDRKPPDEPSGVSATGGVTKWGWTSDPLVTVAHDDPSDSPDFVSESGWKSATFDLRESANGEVVQSHISTLPAATTQFTLPHEGRWDVGVTYRDNAENVGNRAHAFVGYDLDTPLPADPEPLGWISLNDLYAGIDQTWTPPPADEQLESGICGYSFDVDDEQLGIPSPEPNVLAPTTRARVPAEVGEGRHFAHLRAVACNGKASATETAPVNVDGSAPVPVLHGLGADGWMTTPPNFSVSASDSGSGTAALEFGFAGVSALQLHPGSAAAATVPEGASTFTYRAIDNVGNRSELQSREIKADWTGPTVEFLPDDLARPNLVNATVADAHSGLATAALQIRRTDEGASAGESAWHALGGSPAVLPEGRKDAVLSQQIPDGDLAPGRYEIRVSARDVAGNWSEASPGKQVNLPLRAQSTISAAIGTVGRRSLINWSGAAQDRTVRFGSRAALVGTLQDGGGDPVVGARLTIAEDPEFGAERQLGEATTNAAGEFVIRLVNGPTRTFTVRFDGSDRLRPSSAIATIRVRAALSLKVNPRRVRSGRSFTFSGRLFSGDMGTPEGGKIVTIYYLRKRSWNPIATPRVDQKGRFKVRWPELSAKRPTTVYFQVRANREGNWPFLSGSSKTVALRIIP